MLKKIKEKLSNMKDKIRKLKSENSYFVNIAVQLAISFFGLIIGIFIIRRNLQRLYPNIQSIGGYLSQFLEGNKQFRSLSGVYGPLAALGAYFGINIYLYYYVNILYPEAELETDVPILLALPYIYAFGLLGLHEIGEQLFYKEPTNIENK